MQLQEHLDQYRAAGLGVVALTYDDPALQNAFVSRFDVAYPVLSDMEAFTVKALGILNAEYGPGHPGYGIPYPGVFVLDRSSMVRGKVFVVNYEQRVDAVHVLEYASEVLDLGSTAQTGPD